jgi:hypothetical protein
MNNLSHRNNVYAIFSSILAGLLITTLISSTVLMSCANAGTTNTNNANTDTNNTNPITITNTNTNSNSTNILYHIDQAQKAIQTGNITSASRHLDLAKQSLESNPLHTIQHVPPLKGPPVPPKGPIKEPTEPASNLSRGDK